MKVQVIVLLWGALLLLSCTSAESPPNQLTIFAAASLTDAFTQLATEFEATTGIQSQLNFAGSSQLAVQLREGAVADIFASADPDQMGRVVESGMISAETVQTATTNQLTAIVPAANPANINDFADIAAPNVQLVLAAPGVPIRTYTDQLVGGYSAETVTSFSANFYSNLVSEEDNVRRIAAKIALGEADVGIVYKSDILALNSAEIAAKVIEIPIPESHNVTATYPIAPLAAAPNPDAAQQFIDFVLSEDGQQILARWGFGPQPK